MNATFWLGADGDRLKSQPIEDAREPDGLRHLADLFRRVSMLEAEVAGMKWPSWPLPADLSVLRIGSPPIGWPTSVAGQ
jgi:hypothetical protein